MPWRLIEEDGRDIFQNLAIEEALAKVNAISKEKRNTLRFWRANSAVVIGRFQCLHKEVNIGFCEEQRIAIARRFTGGGTVYQDKGNLNFTVCADRSRDYSRGPLPNLYKSFVGGIAEALEGIDIPAKFDEQRSCIRIGAKKITGTAGWIKQGVAFIHGTLLIDSSIDILQRCLSVPEIQPMYLREGKMRCMESKRDSVTTVHREVENPPPDGEIKNAIIQSIEDTTGESLKLGTLTRDELENSERLYQSRYSHANWNRGERVPDKDSS
ncbi:MAG: lipoate--protein ligase family protein [Candidatus Thorarchaeota archaeon]|nr:lipoate--protein ligase family protein [Candidatus Thorarchaeota archaeon]